MDKTVGELVRWAEQCFLAEKLCFGHGTDNAFDEAVWLVLTGAQLSDDDIETVWETELVTTTIDAVRDLVHSRIRSRKPAAYLTHEACFAGLRFFVDERVVVPRSYIGEFIPGCFSPWLKNPSVSRVLDLCTGSGCIAVGLANVFPTAQVWASDISEDALAVAAINVQRHGFEARVHLIRSDLFDTIPPVGFDLIVANPPYVSTRAMGKLPPEYRAEPAVALAAGKRGLDVLDRIFACAHEFLTPDGSLIVEAGSASAVVEQTYPNVPFPWLTASDGESRVCIFSRPELMRHFGSASGAH